MKPPRPYMPGDELNARELTDTANSAYAGQQMSAGGDSEKINPPGGGPGAGAAATGPYIFARVTGKGSGCADSGSQSGNPYYTPPPDNCYCGIQQESLSDGTVDDADAGLTFDSFAFPLVEMTGREDVPVDAIVMAIPSADYTHYEFVWEANIDCHSGSGSGCGSGSQSGKHCCIRISELFVRTETGCAFKDGCLCITEDGLVFIPDP